MKFSVSRAIPLALALALTPAAMLCAQQPADATPAATAPPAASLPPANPQQPSVTPGAAGNDPSLSIRAEKVLADSEPSANEDYTLGAGDEIALDFPGRPEL